MERRFYDIAEMRRDSLSEADCRNCSSAGSENVPQCINTDYCVDTPENRNDGILTMAFVDMQPLESVYPSETALMNGTLFPNINRPFYGGMYK